MPRLVLAGKAGACSLLSTASFLGEWGGYGKWPQFIPFLAYSPGSAHDGLLPMSGDCNVAHFPPRVASLVQMQRKAFGTVFTGTDLLSHSSTTAELQDIL